MREFSRAPGAAPFLALALALMALVAPDARAGADQAYCPMPAGSYPPFPAPPVGDVVLADLNMRIGKECDGFKPSDARGDFYELAQATRKMLREGMACVERQGVRAPIERLKSILRPGSTDRPIELVCGNNGDRATVSVGGTSYKVTGIASAILPGNGGYPGVIFNLDWIRGSNVRNFKAAFFHELFHTAGFDHRHNVDYAYLSAGCCFEDSADACDLLKRSTLHGDNWWKSQEYLVAAVKWFRGRDDVAWDLIHSAAESVVTPDDRGAVIAALVQFRTNLADYGTLTPARHRTLVEACEAVGGGSSCRKAF